MSRWRWSADAPRVPGRSDPGPGRHGWRHGARTVAPGDAESGADQFQKLQNIVGASAMLIDTVDVGAVVRRDAGCWKIGMPKASATQVLLDLEQQLLLRPDRCAPSAPRRARRPRGWSTRGLFCPSVDEVGPRCRRRRPLSTASRTATRRRACVGQVLTPRRAVAVDDVEAGLRRGSRISSYSLAARGLLAANRKRTSIGVVDAGLVEQLRRRSMSTSAYSASRCRRRARRRPARRAPRERVAHDRRSGSAA